MASVTLARLSDVGGLLPSTCQGRLTLTTGVPVTTSDVTAATTLYFTPYLGNRVGTYSGSAWSVSTFTEKSITLASLTASLPYDVFIVDSTLALELLAWTNTTTRATALTLQDGIEVKSGATTRRYLGTICITVTTGQCEDSVSKRLVWNRYNQLIRPMRVVDTTDTWTLSVTAPTWESANASTTNRVSYVQGLSEAPILADVAFQTQGGSGKAAAMGVGIDSTTANSAQVILSGVNAGGYSGGMARYRGFPGIGFHFLQWVQTKWAGVPTIEGDGGLGTASGEQSGLSAELWG